MIENEIIRVEHELMEAVRIGEVNSLDRLLHDHLLFNGPDGKTITKSIIIGNYLSGNIQVEEMISSDRELSIVDDTAIVVENMDITASFMKQTIYARYRYLHVWKHSGEYWKLIGGACIPVAGNMLEEEKLS